MVDKYLESHNGEIRARCETDATRSLSCSSDDTAVKTFDDACLQRNAVQNVQEHRVVCGITEHNSTRVSVNANQLSVGIFSVLSEVECKPSGEEIDGPEPDTASAQPVRQGTALSPTCASLKNDSGYFEQDGTVSPLIPPVKCMTVNSNVSAHGKPAKNDAGHVTLRNYQMELAEPGCRSSNCIICAPTGSGKTFTAGYVCKTRRDQAIAQRCRFKCLFVVCVRNLIAQQRDALCQIIPESGVVCGMDDKLLLSEYFRSYDVVVATAQVCKYVGCFAVVIWCAVLTCSFVLSDHFTHFPTMLSLSYSFCF